MKKIEVTKEVARFIMQGMGVSQPTLWRALNYMSDSDIARRIRKLAMLKGGVVWSVDADQMDTIHDSEGRMIQSWAEGRVILEADKNTGAVRVLVNGEEKESYEHVSVAQLMKIQQRLAVMAATL